MLWNLTRCFQSGQRTLFACMRCDYWFLVWRCTVRLFAPQKCAFDFAPCIFVFPCANCRGHKYVTSSFMISRAHSSLVLRMNFFGLQRSRFSRLYRFIGISANSWFLAKKCTLRAPSLPWVYHIPFWSFCVACLRTVCSARQIYYLLTYCG